MPFQNVLEKFSLRKKVALVTGGAGPQYGRWITAALAEAGAQTYIAGRTLETLEKVAAEHRTAGREVLPVQFDQADETSILNLRNHILKQSGHIDILVNNAVLHTMHNGHKANAGLFDKSLHVNATGLFVISRAFADAMGEDRGGSIINVSSIYGLVGPDPTHYRGTSMSGWQPDYYFHKAGIINLARYFAAYYGPRGVRCNTIVLGSFYTDKLPRAFIHNYNQRTYLGRQANGEDVKGIVVFLASDASVYITAATIPVDGGYTAK